MPAKQISFAALALTSTLLAPTEAFWRMPCPGRLLLERIDPIVDPGEVSGHVHTVSGGSGFGFNTSFEQQRASACSSCPIKQDMSAYWTPKLYWMSEDGTQFEDVPQAGESEGVTGGMTVYYEQRGPDPSNLTAFPEGFRMIAGDPFQRNDTGLEAAPGKAVSYVCLDYTGASHPETGNMPGYNCPDGLRAQVFFPSCWNGVDLDSEDHSSHMAYPIGDYDNGKCPDSHPVQLISIFYEVIYQTNLFADRWWSDGQQPFVFAQGDRTGYGFHGDFINGWEIDVLQKAVDECTNDSGRLEDCPVFGELFTDEECQACRLPTSVDEKITGNLTSLPGCNPPTDGPEYATPQSCNTPAISSPTQYFTNVIESLGWEYQGCASDDIASRTLTGGFTWSDDMTVQHCIDYCKGEGFSLAGLEFANQCYCGNDYANQAAAPDPKILGNCWQPCAGNDQEVCGGSGALSVYKSCDGDACSNAVFHVNGTESASSPSSGGGSSEKRKRHIHKHAHGHAKLH
ncbi:WSC-domain-containing protein [Hortaea werneckii]|uniref:WSC domain-containing protein n=1 Tax=Hortaea werneckii TaxID=91943 RepID=A0A3M7D9G5_HORWE|nr:WSC-domain-containing protein [Hortaea werneckii]RMY60945.1 hypothetical protein D0865_01265 [Hortaea werneckii]